MKSFKLQFYNVFFLSRPTSKCESSSTLWIWSDGRARFLLQYGWDESDVNVLAICPIPIQTPIECCNISCTSYMYLDLLSTNTGSAFTHGTSTLTAPTWKVSKCTKMCGRTLWLISWTEPELHHSIPRDRFQLFQRSQHTSLWIFIFVDFYLYWWLPGQ